MHKDTLSRANISLAAAFGVIAAVVGVTTTRDPLAVLLLTGAAVGFYVVAEARGWLLPSPRPLRNALMTAGFAVLVSGFVGLTGGLSSPLLYALYLPVLLAGLCFGMGTGLAASAVMAALWAWLATGGHVPPPVMLARDVAIALSFPLAAIFARLVSRQLEHRYRELDKRASDLTDLVDMSQMMDTAADLDTTLNLILLNVEKVTKYGVCAIYLHGEGQMLELRASSGPEERTARLRPFLAMADARGGAWNLREAADEDGRALYVPDAVREDCSPPGTCVYDLDPQAASFACVPLLNIDALLGMLYVGFDRAQGMNASTDLHRLEKLAERAAFALGRAVMQHDFRSLAFSDPMTGLDNFRQFEKTLDSELNRAQRYARPLSLVLLDIDHFKQFNDTLGHQAGDALLAQIGGVLRDCLRVTDRPARYGGEEFVVLCPETGPQEALLVAERIRAGVERTNFALPGAGEPRRVTVSVGFSSFPGDAQNGRDLIRGADLALYAAKAAGRNQVRGPQEMLLPV